jgi:hypothetical protein
MGTPESDQIVTSGISPDEAESYLKKLQTSQEVNNLFAQVEPVVVTILKTRTIEVDPGNYIILRTQSDSVEAGSSGKCLCNSLWRGHVLYSGNNEMNLNPLLPDILPTAASIPQTPCGANTFLRLMSGWLRSLYLLLRTER